MVESNEPKENPTGEELAQIRCAELESLLAQKEEALRLANTRIPELEQKAARQENDIEALKRSSLDLDQRLAEASEALSRAVSSYKAQVTRASPEVPPDLIAGDTIEAVDDSLEKAQDLIRKVKAGLETESKTLRFPAGAPPRGIADSGTLSPREKIKYGIGGKR